MAHTAIVILNWQGLHLMQEYLPQVIAHTPAGLADVWVADNGSTDGSLEWLAAHMPQVKLLDLKENHGFALGYNKALAQIEADFYVIMNSDVITSANWLPPLLQRMETTPNCVAVMPKLRALQRPAEFEYAGAAGGMLDGLGYPFCRGRILDTVETDSGQYDEASEVQWATGACMLVRANTFKQLGGFDADFWAHMEEIDFCWRARTLGHTVWVEPGSVVYHLGGAMLGYESPRKLFLNFRNNLFMLAKNLPAGVWFPVLFLRMLLDGAAAIMLLLQGKTYGLGVVLRAHGAFYTHLPALWRKRKQIRATAREQAYAQHKVFSIVWAVYTGGVQTFSALRQYKANRAA